MKSLYAVIPLKKILPILLGSIAVSLLIRKYPLFTYQGSYFVLIEALLFSVFLVFRNLVEGNHLDKIRQIIKRNYLLFGLMAIVVLAMGLWFVFRIGRSILAIAHASEVSSVYFYKIQTLSMNYQTFGLIKRGLIATIVNLISPKYGVELYSAKFIGIFLLLTGVVSNFLSRKFLISQRQLFLAVCLLAPLGLFYQTVFVSGIYDATIIGLFLISISMRPGVGSIIIDVAGLLVHEAYFLLRIPFLLADLLWAFRNRKEEKKNYGFGIINLVILLSVFLFMNSNMAKVDNERLQSNIINNYSTVIPPSRPIDFTATVPMSKNWTMSYLWREGMLPFFHTRDFYSFCIPLFLSIGMISLLSYFTNNLTGQDKHLDFLITICAFFSPLLLCFAGWDYGRWLNFAFLNWVFYYVLIRSLLFPEARISNNCLYGVFLTFLLLSPFGTYQHPLFYTLLFPS